MIDRNIVFVPLVSPLKPIFLSGTPVSIGVGGFEFTRSEPGDITGFYDWLRKDGHVVGVEVVIFEDFQFLLYTLGRLEYVVVQKQTSSGAILASIFFFSTRTYDSDKSNDQLFDENYIYETDSGEYGLTFNLPDNVEYDDLKRLVGQLSVRRLRY